MSVPFDPTKAQTNMPSTSETPAAGGLTSFTGASTFSFGATGTGDAGKQMTPGFSLMSTPTQNKPGGLYGIGMNTTPGQNTGFSFCGTSTASTPTIGATLGNTVTSAQTSLPLGSTPSTGISFGATPVAQNTGFPALAAGGTTPGFGLGSSTATSTAPTTGLTFGAVKPTINTGFSLGGGEPTPTPGATGLTFGTPNTMTTGTGFNLGSTPTSTTASSTTTTATGFGIGSIVTSSSAPGLSLDPGKTSTVQTGFSIAPTTSALQPDSGFGTSTANTTASTGFSLGGTGTTSAATGFTFGAGTTAATTTGFSLNKSVSAAAPSSLATPSTQISLGTTTTVSSATGTGQPAAINFFQLEESINKWTLELEEQEKVFVNQAAQVNAWDKLLITNGEKIVTLNQEVERVKIEQQQLEHELDYVVGQQKELQDCLVPLEKELASLSVSDPEREYTYRLAEDLDTQLKQMSEDLKEIIEHLNEANRTQDSSDPIVQIGKILNAHMNSLQWLDQQTALLRQKIQQIDQMHQNFRQENERSFSLAYN